MNSLENPTTSIEKDNDKKDDSSKKKSRRIASKLIDSEVRNKPEVEKPFLSLEPKEKEDASKEDKESEAKPAPLESLSSEEEIEAAILIRSEARDARASEVPEDETDQAIAEALDSYDSKIIDEGLEPSVAFAEVLEDHGIDPEIASVETVEEVPIEQSEQEIDLSSEQDEGELPLTQAAVPEQQLEHNPPKDEDKVPSGGQGGGDRRPPTSFSPGEGSNSAEPNPWRSSRFNPNVIPPAGVLAHQSYNTIRRDHRDYWSGFMTGGIVGYFVGHRRGRIKTEKKLETVKKKLEKQVNTLAKELQTQEYAIRKLVKTSPANSEKIRPTRANVVLEKPVTKPERARKENKPVLPAAEIHLGQLVMADRPKYRENREQLERVRKQAPRIETMSNPDLLKLSEQIDVDDTNLRKIYETQLVGEMGLRRVLAEYVAGGDLKEALKREIVEHQIDFERDPAMRDLASAGSSVSGTGQKSLEEMIKQAEASIASSDGEVALLKSKVSEEKNKKHKDYQPTRAINAVFLAIIAVLVVVIVLLSLQKLN